MDIKLSDLMEKRDVFDSIDDKVAELRSKDVKVIDFGVGDPQKNYAPPEFVMDSLSRFAYEKRHAGYPGNKGQLSYLEACAEYMKREFGVRLDPKTEVNITRGSKEGVFHFPMVLVNPGDAVIVPTPGYPPFHLGTLAARAKPYYVPLLEKNDFLVDFEAVPEEIVRQAKLIWINYPNSPTGKSAPREWLERLVAWARSRNIVIASDEGAYIEFYFEKKPTSILEISKEGVVAFYSLSKRNNMTGYRVGFVCGDAGLIDGFYRLKTQMDDGLPHFVQDAAALALRDVGYIGKMRDVYRQKREIIMAALESVGLPKIKSDSTFFLWQKAPEGMTGQNLFQKFLDIGIVVMPGHLLGKRLADGANPGEKYVRLALMPTIEDTKEAADRLLRKDADHAFVSRI